MPAGKRATFAEKLTERLRHLERLITDMLAFARQGGEDHCLIEVDGLLRAVEQAVSDSCRARDIELVLSPPVPAEAVITGNRTLLMTLFQNLIGNALEVTGPGGEILLSARALEGRIRIAVRDEGPGIAPELQERIFEPFVTTRSGGTGLGLAVARAIARAHRGEISVQSRPGEGSTFTVGLPLARS